MTPEIALLILQALLKYGPKVAAKIHDMFSGQKFDPATWNELFDSITVNARKFLAETKGEDGSRP